ncbi:MAG: cupin domain-containing protein [Actinomycetales bacterium]|nr:cupin domain-containing protein [Actinomycetales bacterium]
MQLCTAGDALLRQPPSPNSPTVAVFFGGTEMDSHDVGVVRVSVPPGGGMPPHRHSGSDVILVPTAGSVTITKEGGQRIEVSVGDAALIGRNEAVALDNPGADVAVIIVAAGPADFVAGIRNWPEARAS